MFAAGRAGRTRSAPGSLRRKASGAEASRTESVTRLPLRLLAAVADQLLGEEHAGRGDGGEGVLDLLEDPLGGADEELSPSDSMIRVSPGLMPSSLRSDEGMTTRPSS